MTPRTRLLLALLPVAAACAPLPRSEMEDARRDAARRPRRVIMNNDGNDCVDLEPGTRASATELLRRRTLPLDGSHVDAIFYCDGVFDMYTHRSTESQQLGEIAPGRTAWAEQLWIETGRDPLTVMIEHCHERGTELFWSMRMNDTHDSSPARRTLLAAWKQRHPEMLVATADAPPPFGGKRWSALDYGHAEVRDKVFRIVADVITRYDVDGIELDFFRHPVFFKAAAFGRPVPLAMQDAMSDLMRRIRELADAAGAARGRPILIAARLPDSVDYCRSMGLDVERWLGEGLLDLIVGGGYIRLRPWQDWVALGQRHDVPVYACLSASRLVSDEEPEGGADLQLWRAEALRAWDAGVDGIYTFNRFDPQSPLFRELGDPELLRRLPHEYRYVRGRHGQLHGWVVDGGEHLVPDHGNADH